LLGFVVKTEVGATKEFALAIRRVPNHGLDPRANQLQDEVPDFRLVGERADEDVQAWVRANE
jgi:hypothetical protein